MKKECSRCGGKEHRRLNREGFFEKKILTFFGIYPWECALCRSKVYMKTSGQRSKSRRSSSASPSSNTQS